MCQVSPSSIIMSILLQYVATEGVAWSATIVHHPVSSSANIQNTTVGLPSNISTNMTEDMHNNRALIENYS